VKIKTPGPAQDVVIKSEDFYKALVEFREGATGLGREIDLMSPKETLRTLESPHARIEELQKKNQELKDQVEACKKLPSAGGKYLGRRRSIIHVRDNEFIFTQETEDSPPIFEERSVTYDFSTGLFDAGGWGKAVYFPNTHSMVFMNGRDPISAWTKTD
jgi:hypothetical protein